jgi:predicted Zn-dependent protease
MARVQAAKAAFMFLRIAVVLLAVLPLTAQQPAGSGVNFYSLEKEAALGQQMAAEVRQRMTVLESAPAQDYLNRLGQRIAAQLPGAKWTYSFSLIANDDGGATREPTALPAGYIFVPATLVLAAQDEGEFAGMMAHAMAHVAARDWTRQATRGEIAQMGMIATAQSAGSGWNGDAIRQAGGLQVPLTMLSSARKSHLEADALGAKAMAGAGFNPEALVRYLDRERRDRPGTVAVVFSDLPDRETRMAALRGLIAGMPASNYAAPGQEFTAFQQEVRRLTANPPPPPLKRDNGK